MKNFRTRLQILLIAILLPLMASAQEIRYVSMTGDNSKDGRSWATAKKDVQDAINDLVNNNLTGEVWVAAGTYYPTETTESSSSPYHKSFKIPAGITVRGGFRGKVEADAENAIAAYDGEASLADRHMEDDNLFGEAAENGKSEDTGNLDGEAAGSGVYSNKTVLCGDLNEDKVADVTWNEQKQQFDVTFYGNSYHVVWFAMNGFDGDGRANPLVKPAKLEGCVVQGGHAFTRDAVSEHPHEGYGGGIYMVANSFVYNSEVKNCDASRNGGGIYMDGGGIVRRTFVHDCQALGIGTEYGLGGGICEEASEHNSKANPIVVAQSAVTNCVARIGGGMALVADKAEGNNKYAIVANSTIVNNNTAQVEAGGVYTYKGGGLASMTVVRNKCNGSGITQNGVITGRSGGVYCRDAAYIGNTVIWGNECAANKNIQYADSRSSLASSEKTKFYYSALSNAEITDWSKTEKMGVLSLDEANSTTVANKGNKGYPLFEKPTATTGYIANYSAGKYDWKVFSESALHHAGINTADLDYEGLTPAPQGVSYDMQFGVFNSRCTMGALVSEEPKINARIEGAEAHFFVDPSYNFAAHHDQEAKGASWDLPTRFLGNVLEYINADRKKSTPEFASKQIFIHVKEGTVDNTDSYKSGRVRTTSLDIPSNVTILGSYDKSLTGTNLDKRNVVRTPTIISGKLLDNYKYNIAHLINIEKASNVTLDGFQISYANAASTELGNTNKYGAAITIKGSTEGILIKNIIVSNSQAEGGAAVYADASTADFENCIFHNNTTTQLANSGVVYATNGSALTFNHCDVLRNVGYASYLGSNNTTNAWHNSIFYGNMDRALSDTNIDNANSDPNHPGLNNNALAAFSGNTAKATGSRCMFDAKSANFASQFGGNDTGNQWQYNLQYAFIEGTGQGYPRFINPTKNAGVTEDGDQTYYGRATSFEPHNNNPIVNLASHDGSHTSWGRDIIDMTRDFGGLPDIGAVENHEAKKAVEGENAYTDGQKAYGEGFFVRDYTATGTQMDTYDKDSSGNLTKNNEGKGIYTANGELLDGTSWEYAINGNAIYALTGTRKKAETTTQTVVKGYRIYTGTNYLIVNSGTLRRDGKNTTGTVFALYDAEGNKITEDAKIGNAKRLVDTSTGNTLYLNLSGSSYTFRTTQNPDEAQATATLTASGGNYSIQYTASNNQKRYIRNNNTIPSTTATNWTFTQVTEQVEIPTGVIDDEDFDMGSFTGLQYAVNLANIRYHDDFNVSGGDVQNSKKQVWVGAGVYKRNPAKNTGTKPSTPIVEMDEENCFIIQDGVDVYGAFPKTGNPGMNEREALVSQYVHVQAERNISNIADFETILEPETKGVTSGVTRRVLGQTYDYNPRKYKDTGNTCPVYTGAKWDGFTLREGVLDAKQIQTPNRNGGAGAAIYGNVTLKNVVVTNNTTIFTGTTASQDFRAGGIYMDGGTVDAGYVINNTLQGWNNSAKAHYGAAYGGGLYIYTGTVFNSVVANNNIYSTYADGAALFIENANFFNNTIVNNKADGSVRGVGGIAVWTDESRGDESVLNVYNTISVNNIGYIADPAGDHCPTGNKDVAIQNGGLINLYNCITENATNSHFERSASKTATITYHYSKSETTPSSIFEGLGNYGDSFSNLNLRQKSTYSYAINKGDDSPTIYGVTYDLSDYNDMDFAERIQDCRIDIGAYEFNGATAIAPSVVGDQAIYYVTPEGYGTTNANDPENAACASKLQRVLDAAGRYKYLNPTKQVIVKVANSYDMANPKDAETEPTNFTYYATRTTDWTDQDVRVWSIIVPRGVEVWGGYTDVASDLTKTSWSNDNNGFSTRDITKNPTYFDSYYVNKLEKTDAHTYHVVTFSDRIFDINGYAYTKEDFNGKTAEQIRTIIQNGTASTYVELPGNDETLFAHMSEAIDGVSAGVSGNVIMADAATPKNFGTSDAPVYASNRAVLDGIFVSGGKADAASNSNNSAANINSYGGAALVNEHAYVRNCILTGNTATNGGALALTDHALVSGCLIINNEAKNAGGGIYVFENGTKLSDGTTVQTMQKVGDQTMDYNMPHVFTSTIVNNKAQQGGGIWFTSDVNSNARFNSVAVWQNEAADQSNVYGMVNPEQPTEDETISEIFYPFSYSLIQDLRASGTNNLNAMAYNRQGVRFVNKNHDVDAGANKDQTNIAEENSETALAAKYADFGYYGLTTYSMLCSNGMPNTMYNQLKEAIAISDVDFMSTDRIDNINNFVEIGARALPKRMPNKQLMLRLFVAHPDVVDTETATRFMRLNGTAGTPDGYYSQMGSSFAYPFNFLQDAIDYITRARNGQITGLKLNDGTDVTTDMASNLPFEIVLGSGTYYPRQSLNGATENVWAHTFAIPEGVTIIGGFNPLGGDNTYYGRYYQKGTIATSETGDIYNYVEPIPSTIADKTANEVGRGNKFGSETVTLPAVVGDAEHAAQAQKTITFQQWHIQDIADRRAMADNNKNGIIEPWEFANQTIISGNAVNGETDGVYHVMTAVADEDAVGKLPKVKSTNPAFTSATVADETGYQWHEEGQQIRLNGLIVTGGNALTYLSTALDEYGKYIFYQGAGLQVDGNRYKNNSGDKAVFHNSAAYGVGYRDIPVSITNCQFRNNVAGYGGAISSNGSLSLFGSSFEQNLALAQTETPEPGETWTSYVNGESNPVNVTKVMYPGQGGAILATHQLSAFNTLFANNEARLGDGEEATIELVKHPTFRVPDENAASATLRAAGGAIMMGSAAQHHIVNCDFVRNKANAYPAVFTMNPTKQQNDAVNTHNYSQIINTVAWGNEVNQISSDANYLRASKLMVNIGKKDRTQNYITTKGATDFYSPAFTDGLVPTETDLGIDNADASGDWQEAAWFCAYEDGAGFKPNNTNDLRDAIVYTAGTFAPKMIKDANNSTYQNCNMLIVADNGDVDGPNFGNPSVKAGFDGFMEGADWSPARFNKLTDNGNGWIKQTVSTTADDIIVTFNNDEALGTGYQGAYPYTHYISDIAPGQFPEYKLWIAIGNEKYMEATNETDGEKFINNVSIGTPQKNLPRISPDPTKGVTKAYIDIGVYEYQKQPLLKPGNEVDILWVATKEKPENGPANGLTWKTPTSDLQKAIETLLTSRNGHKKEIRIMEGEYAPVAPQTIGGTRYNAFVIDTKSLNERVITPSGFLDDHNNDEYYAQSITIKGGYSADIMYEYDPVKYKTVIRQKESGDGSNTDHLIYIADPTLRYAYGTDGYKEANKQGATFGTTGEAASAKTMPIQIDGVTLINSKAAAEADGSAIYYPGMAGITSAHSVSVGGKVVYYGSKADLDSKENPVDHETEFAEITTDGAEVISDPAKIVITKTQVIGSGKSGDANNGSAVYIGQNGGSALIYNTVFHSNYGMPLNAYNTVNVNNTFGLNAGKVQLQDADDVTVKSQMHNSALWKNNKTSEGYGEQFTGATSFTYNSYTGCPADAADNNTSLSDVNSNIGEGPNFVDPENADIEARSFDIKPSMRLLNKGSETATTGTYYEKILHQTAVGTDKYANYDYALIPTTDVDVLNRARFKNNIDRGAYEFQGSLFEILYVDPNKSHRDDATGENWNDAFGYGDLQNAMDLAAIYHATNPDKEAYVFVKGNSSTNKGENTNETITLRDGVTAYGSILSSNTNWHGIQDEHGNNKYSSVDDYIRDIRLNREGVASTHANQTIVTGIKTADAAFNGTYVDKSDPANPVTYNVPAVIDGFVVTDPNRPTAPVLDITNTSKDATILVRNVIVADNDMSKAEGNVNVAQITNGLIYEALFRDNTPKGNGAVLKVSNTPEGAKTASTKTSGYAVNVTVEGKTIGADGSTPVDGENESGTQIYKSITNSIDGTKDGAYGKIVNKGIFGYYYNIGRIGDSNKSTNADLNYQLSETSAYIDVCEAVNPLTGVADNLAAFINYKTDRDILGNPRLLAGVTTDSKIDRGAFETWKVENDWHTGHDNSIAQQSGYTTTTAGTYEDDIKYTFYPHAGSAVYLMEGKYIVLDAPGAGYDETTSNPGFLLVKDGANLYTNGRHTTVAYVAVERKVRKGGSIVALPYAMDYSKASSVAKVSNTANDGTGDLVLDTKVGRANKYSGNERMDWKYIFQTTDTKCWDQISKAAANQGVLFEPNGEWYASTDADNTEALLRFTAQGAVINDYIYEEYGTTKTVTLTQYDDAQSSNNGADFTDHLDMGWNCIGIPYLVSEYKPYEKVAVTDEAKNTIEKNDEGTYSMNIPHTLWLYYDGTTSPDRQTANGDGGYYSVKAWKSEASDWHAAADAKKALWVGEGFFTQTATLDDTEALTFYRPVAPQLVTDGGQSNAPRVNTRYFYDANGIEDLNDDMNGNRRGESVIKFVRNGKVYIQKNGKTYTAAGQLVEEL